MRIRSPRRPYNLPRPPKTIGTPRGPAGGVVNHAFHDHAKHFIPWVVLLLAWLAGTMLHVYATTTWSLAGTVFLLVTGTAGLAWSVWETCRDRGPVSRWHGFATVTLSGSWLVMATINGLIKVDTTDPSGWVWTAHGPTIGYWFLGWFLAASWNARINARDRAVEAAEYLAAMNPEPTRMDNAGLPGARWTLRPVNEWRSEGQLFLAPGQTYGDVTKKLDDLASAHDLPPGSVLIDQPKGTNNARRVNVIVMHGDPLEAEHPWPGLHVKVGA